MIVTTAFNPLGRPSRPSREAADPLPPNASSVPVSLPTETRPSPAVPGTSGVVLPFRRRSVRQPSDRNLEQAVSVAVRLLVAGRVDDAEHRFRELATVARSWEMAARRSAWQLPSWVGVVVCHALRHEWLSAEMAACEHLSEMAIDEVADAYIAAVALGNEWLVNVPEQPVRVEDADRPAELRRFPRSTPQRESAHPDPARDYAYALVSALRFRLGAGTT